MPAHAFDIQTPDGVLPAHWYRAHGAATPSLVVFAHGAGAGQGHPFMQRYADGLAARGLDVVTFDFPYMAARRKAPDRAPTLERAFLAAVEAAVTTVTPRPGAVVLAGKSMGGRMATHLAAQPDVWTSAVPLAGVVALGYPLTPPGPRGGDRVSHLGRLAVPLLVVQGTRDSFGGPDAVATAVAGFLGITILPVPTGDHSLKVLASSGQTQAHSDAAVLDAVGEWARARAGERAG